MSAPDSIARLRRLAEDALARARARLDGAADFDRVAARSPGTAKATAAQSRAVALRQEAERSLQDAQAIADAMQALRAHPRAAA